MIRFITQTRALQGASILYVLARNRAETHDQAEWRLYWRRVAMTYEYAAACVCPALGYAGDTLPQGTLLGIDPPKTVAVRMNHPLQDLADAGIGLILTAALSTGCALDVYGTGPAPEVDAGGAPTVAVVETTEDAAPAPTCGPDTCAGCCVTTQHPATTVCILNTSVAVCGAAGRACVDCTKYGAYCNAGGFCSVDPAGAPAGWDGGR